MVECKSGKFVGGVLVSWIDGVGVLVFGIIEVDGIVDFCYVLFECSYVIGNDCVGGVFIFENFYYDSEIYNIKLYVFIDCLLYCLGDEVSVKFIGCNFKNVIELIVLVVGDIKL